MMKIERLCLVTGVLLSCALSTLQAQVNRPPRFSVGGDMAHFSIPENVDVGSTIYKLRGTDPEGGSVYFSISGEYFSVNKHTGDVTLIKELDRELSNSVEVIISITGTRIFTDSRALPTIAYCFYNILIQSLMRRTKLIRMHYSRIECARARLQMNRNTTAKPIPYL